MTSILRDTRITPRRFRGDTSKTVRLKSLAGFAFTVRRGQPRFHDWAFNLDEHELAKKWADIPDDTDILILHGPPHGIGDLARDERGMPVHVGSPSLAKRIEEIRTRLVVFGHIHAGYGVYKSGRTTYVNASHCDERYRPVNAPILLTFDMNDFARDAE